MRLAFEPAADKENFRDEWFVLHTKSRQEKALADDLAARGIDHYLPVTREMRVHGHRKIAIDLPLFAGYLFLNGSVDDAYTADRSGRVANILRVADQEQIGRELHEIRTVLSAGGCLRPHPFLHRGTRVVVRTGPFAGLHGVTESHSRRGRLVLQVTMLGQAVSVNIESHLLEPDDDITSTRLPSCAQSFSQ